MDPSTQYVDYCAAMAHEEGFLAPILKLFKAAGYSLFDQYFDWSI